MEQERDFPKPIVNIIKALNSKYRRRILIELDGGALPYSEIQERIKLKERLLKYHLKKLIASGLVRHFLKKEESNYISYYELSDLGRYIFDPFKLSEYKNSST